MKPPSSPHTHPQKGVALLEVLVAILLFSLGVLGLIGLQARAISSSIDADDRNRAALLANDIASLMWINKTVTLGADTVSAWQARVADPSVSGLANGIGTITAVTSGPANSADILIKWKAPSRTSTDTSSQLSTRVTLP